MSMAPGDFIIPAFICASSSLCGRWMLWWWQLLLLLDSHRFSLCHFRILWVLGPGKSWRQMANDDEFLLGMTCLSVPASRGGRSDRSSINANPTPDPTPKFVFISLQFHSMNVHHYWYWWIRAMFWNAHATGYSMSRSTTANNSIIPRGPAKKRG